MCLVVFRYDSDAEIPFLLFETRDEEISRKHGDSALKALNRDTSNPYGVHWTSDESLNSLHLLGVEPSHIQDAEIYGGFDQSGGTWSCVSAKNGIVAKLLVARFPDGQLGERTSSAATDFFPDLEIASRTGICLTAVSFPTAAETASKLPKILDQYLSANSLDMLPFRLVFGDDKGAYVFHYQSISRAVVTTVEEKEICIGSTTGINDHSSNVSAQITQELATQKKPRRSARDWGETILEVNSALASQHSYNSNSWRAFEHSVFQPPYIGGAVNTHHYPARYATDDDIIEWTCSSSLSAVSGNNSVEYLVEDRGLLSREEATTGTSFGTYFPSSTDDYTQILGH